MHYLNRMVWSTLVAVALRPRPSQQQGSICGSNLGGSNLGGSNLGGSNQGSMNGGFGSRTETRADPPAMRSSLQNRRGSIHHRPAHRRLAALARPRSPSRMSFESTTESTVSRYPRELAGQQRTRRIWCTALHHDCGGRRGRPRRHADSGFGGGALGASSQRPA